MYLTKAFIESLQVAMQLYENRFKKSKKDMPEHRIFDLIELKALLEDKDKTIKEIYELLEQTMEKMKTGWIVGGTEVFGTGNSRLKDHLNQVLERSNYSLDNLLSEQARSTKETKLQSGKYSADDATQAECELLKQKLCIQQAIIEEQTKQINSLQQDKQVLLNEIAELKALLDKLQQTNNKAADNMPSTNPFDSQSQRPPGFFSTVS